MRVRSSRIGCPALSSRAVVAEHRHFAPEGCQPRGHASIILIKRVEGMVHRNSEESFGTMLLKRGYRRVCHRANSTPSRPDPSTVPDHPPCDSRMPLELPDFPAVESRPLWKCMS